MKRSKKRTLLMVLLLLTGGAIINVAVAWGCSLWSRGQLRTPVHTDSVPDAIASVVPDDWMSRRKPQSTLQRVNHAQTLFGLTTTESGAIESYDGEWVVGPGRILHLCRAGWPMRSLMCCGCIDSQPVGTPLVERWIWGLRSPKCCRSQNASILPISETFGAPLALLPLWPGFAINTIFYAAILWLFFAAPGFVRRRFRIKRGRCSACAYPVGTSPVCTECGKPVRRAG